MKVAVIGSRTLNVDLDDYIPEDTTEIVSGGAKGIDLCAKEYALKQGKKYTEFLPLYNKYGKAAPIKRNDEIIEYADIILAFWDGKSRGTKYVIDRCIKLNKAIKVIKMQKT